jgi:arylsulfatase A-like enzyme
VHDLERRNMSAMISALDEGIGDTVASLKASGLWPTTLMVAHTDNVGVRAWAPPAVRAHIPVHACRRRRRRRRCCREGNCRTQAGASLAYQTKTVERATTSLYGGANLRYQCSAWPLICWLCIASAELCGHCSACWEQTFTRAAA